MSNGRMQFFDIEFDNDGWAEILQCGDISVWYYYEEEDEPFGYLEMSHMEDERVFEKYWFVPMDFESNWEEQVQAQAEAFYFESLHKYDVKEEAI